MVEWNVVDRFEAVQPAPFAMRHGLIWPVEIALNVFEVKRVVDGPLVHPLNAVVIIAERDVHAGVADVFRVKGVADDVSIADRLPDLGVAINGHLPLSIVHSILDDGRLSKQA